MKVSQTELVIALEWVLFIGLSIVSVWFASGVFENFFSESSSFSLYEEAVTTHPVLVIEVRDFMPIPLNDVKIHYK